MADVDASRIAVNGPDPDYDWRTVARHLLVSRALDRLEEERLVPERKVLYQFSARGHDMAQVLLGSQLTEQDVITHCRKWLANYKVPRSVEITAQLPRNAAGKILKRSIRPLAPASAGARA